MNTKKENLDWIWFMQPYNYICVAMHELEFIMN